MNKTAQRDRLERAGVRITWLSFAANLVLGVGKTAVGLMASSGALVADGMNSLSDLSTDMAALFGLKMANKPEDENHLYGHHKFSSMSSLFIALMVLVVCVALVVSSAWALFNAPPLRDSALAIIVALVSLAVKVVLSTRTRALAVETGSRVLMANAMNQRTDALSSLLVVVALVSVTLGGESWAFVDKAVGMVMGAWFAVGAFRLMLQSLNDLLDAAPERAMIDDIREHILAVDGALGYHRFRSRRVGDRFEVDMHLQVDASLSVEQGHEIASAVRDDILRQHPEVVSVLIHVEPAKGRHMSDKGISDRECGC